MNFFFKFLIFIDENKWKNYSLQPFFTKLLELKKKFQGIFTIHSGDKVIIASWESSQATYLGIFNVTGTRGA